MAGRPASGEVALRDLATTVTRMAADRSTPDRDLAAPSNAMLVAEARAVREVPRILWRSPKLWSAPKGSATVLALPGFGTGDLATAPVRSFLASRGHRTHGWGLGVNGGDVEELVPPATDRARELAEKAGGPIALVGWSLGGVVGREVARDEPNLISQVITYGTPVVGGPKYTRSAAAYGPDRVAAIEQTVAERNQIPIEVPITAIHSRLDGIVDWLACIDEFSPQVRNIEVRSSHVGMGLDPDVWQIVADALAT